MLSTLIQVSRLNHTTICQLYPHLSSNLCIMGKKQQPIRSFEELNARPKPPEDRSKKLCSYEIIKLGIVSFYYL